MKDRVKSIMNYRRPAFWIIVIALVLCVLVAVCFLTNPLEDSWIKVTHGAASVELECNFAEPINAYAIYEDIYERGELVSSEAIVFDNFQDEGGATPRRTEISLSVQPVNTVGGDGYTGELSVNFGGAGIAYMTRTLPKDHYTDYVHVVSENGNRIFMKQKITAEDSVTLYSIVLSTDLLGVDHKSLVARVQNNTLPQSKDTVVIYRLVTSQDKELNQFADATEIQLSSPRPDMDHCDYPIVPVMFVNQITGEMKHVNSNQSVREIQALISSDWWAEGNPACDYDFKITVNGETYMYHSDCGTFADISADRCIELDENQQKTMDRLLSVAQNDVLDRYWLTIGADGVKSIGIKTAHSSGGCENADGSLYKKGDRIWLESLDGYHDLRGVSFIALGEDGQVIWQASIPDGEDNEGFTHFRNDDWNITNIP